MTVLAIHEPGPLTTVQDLGRPGYLRVGIPGSGPVDALAFVLANRLVGNPDGAEARERRRAQSAASALLGRSVMNM